MQTNTNKGSVVVYIVLMIFLMMTSAAVILSGVLNRHIRSAQDYLSSERAFSAANSGIERMLYAMTKSNPDPTSDVARDGQIDYGTEQASYKGAGRGIKNTTTNTIRPCMAASGTYKDLVRRIAIGEGPDCAP